MPESARIAELRRRMEAEPASSAFAQLAEEYRRAGEYHEAIDCCRAGLTRHPGYLGARVTLGRSLLELGRLDEAAGELEFVLRVDPDNLPALRAMAEIHQRRGALESALELYKRALALARFDADLEDTVNRIGGELGATNRSVMVDFDALLVSLGVPDAAAPPTVERWLSRSTDATPAILPEMPADTAADDPFDRLEHELRAFDGSRDAAREDPAMNELESWLRALSAARVRSVSR